jgi:hypothetical protein
MQSKLENYFAISNKNYKNKICFIYDPDNYKAIYNYSAKDSDTFLTTKIGVKLYYRKPKNNKILKLPKIQTINSIPLLKSNLQKAVRRCETDIAIKTSIVMIEKDPIEFLRRLAIIYIEDVCLFDTYSIVVWLMMAEKEHILDMNDINILLHIVKNLCECRDFYCDINSHIEDRKVFELSHRSLQKLENSDQLLSLFYRSQYGGMKGDMIMLKNSIYYYSENAHEMQNTKYDCIDYDKLDNKLYIISEAIDFHPFPQMLKMIVKLTNLDYNIIKETIWFSESGVNIRKPFTLEKSKEYINGENWKIIESKLELVRHNLIKALE